MLIISIYLYIYIRDRSEDDIVDKFIRIKCCEGIYNGYRWERARSGILEVDLCTWEQCFKDRKLTKTHKTHGWQLHFGKRKNNYSVLQWI